MLPRRSVIFVLPITDGWACAHGARLKNNVVFAARVCQRGDTGADVPTILDRMASWFPA